MTEEMKEKLPGQGDQVLRKGNELETVNRDGEEKN